MSFFFRSAREAQTSVPCKICSNPLTIKRTCHEAYMYCEHCKKDFPLQEYVKQMDDAMENFLESLYANRI